MSYRQATHTKYCLLPPSMTCQVEIGQSAKKNWHGTMRGNFRRCHTTITRASEDVHRIKCLQRLLPSQRCDKCTHNRATHKVEGQNAHCPKWCFSACDGSRSFQFAAKCHLEIQIANGIFRSTKERRFTSRNWWQIILKCRSLDDRTMSWDTPTRGTDEKNHQINGRKEDH